MTILELRILPPLAIGRLGGAAKPLEAFDLEINPDNPLDYRRIVPRESFEIDPKSHEISRFRPKKIHFKDKNQLVRPVAPFLEVYARTSGNPEQLVPLTKKLLKNAGGLKLKDLHWEVELGNIKIYRRTNDPNDKIHAKISNLRDHKRHLVNGKCKNFLPDKVLPLGHVQFIKPNKDFPEIRLRFTPARGRVYGSSLKRHTSDTHVEDDPVITKETLLYDCKKGKWRGYKESAGPTLTMPAQIYAGYADDAGNQVSWGYLDDECDGVVRVKLMQDGKPLSAQAHIGAGPPAYAPDTLPVRVISDEMEQILYGPSVVDEEVSLDDATELVLRALETVRLMNTAVMNGNAVNGQLNTASTMVRQNTNDFERYYEPIAANSLVDNLALRALHERVFSALAAGGAPWFSELLRQPEEIGDLSAKGLRKMPALMRGADGRSLTLTRRHIDMVKKAAKNAMFAAANSANKGTKLMADKEKTHNVSASNLMAQIHHRGTGNPASALPRSAISNCFPGLEFDYRNAWRRAFEGIVLIENNNYVIDCEDSRYQDLVTRRLLRFDGFDAMVPTSGPVFPDGDSTTLATSSNPNAVSFMEWSNSLARIMHKQGQMVDCEFTEKKNADTEVLADGAETIKVPLKLRVFFTPNTAALAEKLLQPGELTQGLCSPWQNDYRECACYYWAASRPDYVNVEPGADGLSRGDMWFSKKRTGNYIPDNRKDTRLWSYDDLFIAWQEHLQFIIQGKDANES